MSLEVNQQIESTFLQAARTDILESENKTLMAGYIGSAVGAVVFNTTKIPLVTMPVVALEALQYTDNSLAAGVAAGTAYGLWTVGTTFLADRALDSVPATKSWLTHRNPTQVEAVTGAFPGLETAPADEKLPTNRFKRFGKFVLTHGERGMTAVGVGANSYVLAAHLDEQPKPAITRLRRGLAIDGGMVMGVLAGTSSEVVRQVSDSHPGLAENIHDGATNPWIGLGVAGSIMLVQGTNKWRSKRRLIAQQAELEQTPSVQTYAEVD